MKCSIQQGERSKFLNKINLKENALKKDFSMTSKTFYKLRVKLYVRSIAQTHASC